MQPALDHQWCKENSVTDRRKQHWNCRQNKEDVLTYLIHMGFIKCSSGKCGGILAAGKEAKISKNYYGGIEKMLFLYYPKCSTCQKAKKWLDANHISYEERHIVEENPTYEELKQWYEKGDLPLKKFFNTSGMLYKEQKLKDKLPDMSEEEQLRLLATNGMLVKRPLIVEENLVLTGFKEKEWTEKLL